MCGLTIQFHSFPGWWLPTLVLLHLFFLVHLLAPHLSDGWGSGCWPQEVDGPSSLLPFPQASIKSTQPSVTMNAGKPSFHIQIYQQAPILLRTGLEESKVLKPSEDSNMTGAPVYTVY